MRWDDLEKSDNIEDRRGESSGGGGGGGFGLPIGGGGLGIGAIAVLGILGWALGIDPRLLIGGAEILSGGGGEIQRPYQPPSGGQARRTGASGDDNAQFVSSILGSTEARWKDVFVTDRTGKVYIPPVLVMYQGQTRAACGGTAQSAMGPFYCPVDRKVYLDTEFFDEIERRFRGCSGKACKFSQAYVIAHEVGHHVQNLLGILPSVQRAQQSTSRAEANHEQVMVELQADCFAGVWAKLANDRNLQQGRPAVIEPGDIDAAMQTASAIGDDTLQRKATGHVVPDSFTHGTSEQRKRWFATGLKEGRVAACDTFRAANL